MQPFLARVFDTLEANDLAYCLMRDAHRLDELAAGGEIDLLVDGHQLDALAQSLAALGCIRLPLRGYEPHHFFLYFDAATNAWFKLDVITDLTFGGPAQPLRTDLGRQCLERRRRVGPACAPSTEDEFVALLLHAVLDKSRWEPHRQDRLRTLRHEVTDTDYLTSLLAAYWQPGTTWTEIADAVDSDAWASLRAQRDQVAAHLARRDRGGSRWRPLRQHALRVLSRARAFATPTIPSVALLGPDGAGKSTLSSGLHAGFCMPVDEVYMGLYPKSAERRERRLPGLGFVQLMIGSWQRYLKARYRQARGHLVIFDRYPYDAYLPSPRQLNPLRRLRRWLLARSCPPPDIVVILDAPGELLHARKGEHTPEILEQQRRSYQALQRRLAHAAVVDAAADGKEVVRQVNLLIWQALTRRESKRAAPA